MKSHWVAHKNH